MSENKNQQIVAGFLKDVLKASKTITYNPEWLNYRLFVEKKEFDYTNVITHPKARVILGNSERAISRSIHPNPKYAHSVRIILMRGTPYGTIVIFGRESDYNHNATIGSYQGPLPRLHVASMFMKAAIRHFNRVGIPFDLVGSEYRLLRWIFSDSFAKDIAAQVNNDKANRIELGDGLPKRAPSTHRTSKPAKHPMDILPCRANGFKGRPASEDEKADYQKKIEAGKPIGELDVPVVLVV